MLDPRRLITLWASTVCYRDCFTFTFTLSLNVSGTNCPSVVIFIMFLIRHRSLFSSIRPLIIVAERFNSLSSYTPIESIVVEELATFRI
jgi:hypothetical protein